MLRMSIAAFLCAAFFFASTESPAQSAPDRANAETFFRDAVKGHPRIYLTEARLARVGENIRHDSNARRASEKIIAYADTLLAAKPIEYVKSGHRMLGPARQTVARIKYLGMAYHLTHEKKYADKAVGLIVEAAAIPSWNPRHYLDAAELSFAVGLGYDWFYEHMTPLQRRSAVRAVVAKGIGPSWSGRQPSWVTKESNWNQVCNGGLGVAALAIWEAEPRIAAKTVMRSLEGMPHTMRVYAPDGVYPEGPSYWAYGTMYAAQFIDALDNVMKTDFGLSAYPGFMESVDAINYLTGPTRRFLNFSDGYRYRYTQAVTYWFASKRKDPNVLFSENAFMARSLKAKPGSGHYPDMVMYLIWSNQAQTATPPAKRHWAGRGVQPVATLRSGWDSQATFAGMKAGVTGVGHGHIDAGSFVMDAEGVRWISDVPSQSYSKGEKAKAAAKAKGVPFEKCFYRERWSHNILLVDNKSPVVNSRSPMLSFSDDPKQPNAVFDLSPAYDGQLTYARRGMALYMDKSLVVQDELKSLGKGNTHVRWSALTYTTVERTGDKTVQLRQGDKTMEVKILSPVEAAFQVLVVNDQKYIHSYDRMPEETRQIVISLELPAHTDKTIAVRFRPGCVSPTQPEPKVVPLGVWAE